MNQSPLIEINVASRYLESQSLPEADRYVFAYTVTICNNGLVPARLLRRHWIITDGNGAVQDVRGEGVVGEQPNLGPGECFQYTSAAMIPTPVGSMYGDYELVSAQGVRIDAEIPLFRLAVPRALN